jgi:hypothetical protein
VVREDVSYEHDTSTSGAAGSSSGLLQPAGPGKANLVDGLIQRKSGAGMAPVGPGKLTMTGPRAGSPVQRRAQPEGAATRDIVPLEDHDGAAAAEPSLPSDPRITTPAPGGGANVAATVVGSTAEPEQARDGGLTPALIAALHANPDLSIDEILQHLAAFSIGGEYGRGHIQHPTIAQYGRMAPGTSGATGGAGSGEPAKKQAVLIANQRYANVSRLYEPVNEATQMQGELSSRGYAVEVHTDKTAADMDSLWGAMVSAAKPGDDLVAHYGGHGLTEGLLGVEHDPPPGTPDIFTNAQVAGVVGAATGKSAHIRMVLDSCHSGAAVQAVREVRQNELAAAATSPDDKLRVEALASLTQMKQRLLGQREQRTTVPGEIRAALDQHTARAPDPSDAAATQKWTKIQASLRDAEVVYFERHDREEDKLWAEMLPQLETIRTLARYAPPPPPISDYSLGPQLNYLDDLWNAVSQPVEDSLAKSAGAAQPGAAQPGAAAATAPPPAAK